MACGVDHSMGNPCTVIFCQYGSDVKCLRDSLLHEKSGPETRAGQLLLLMGLERLREGEGEGPVAPLKGTGCTEAEERAEQAEPYFLSGLDPV